MFARWVLGAMPWLEVAVDVAGGKGALSVLLAAHGVECVVVDPVEARCCNPIRPAPEPHTSRPHQGRPALGNAEGERALGAGAWAGQPAQRPRAGVLASCSQMFDAALLAEWGRLGLGPEPERHGSEASSGAGKLPAPRSPLRRRGCCLVGLHPDEATEPIIAAALEHNVAFAVVPCCVFPADDGTAGDGTGARCSCGRGAGWGTSAGGTPGCATCVPVHPVWRGHAGVGSANARSAKGRGKPQMSHLEFVESLKRKVRAHGRVCHEAFLPVHGKNRVIFSLPAPARQDVVLKT